MEDEIHKFCKAAKSAVARYSAAQQRQHITGRTPSMQHLVVSNTFPTLPLPTIITESLRKARHLLLTTSSQILLTIQRQQADSLWALKLQVEASYWAHFALYTAAKLYEVTARTESAEMCRELIDQVLSSCALESTSSLLQRVVAVFDCDEMNKTAVAVMGIAVVSSFVMRLVLTLATLSREKDEQGGDKLLLRVYSQGMGVLADTVIAFLQWAATSLPSSSSPVECGRLESCTASLATEAGICMSLASDIVLHHGIAAWTLIFTPRVIAMQSELLQLSTRAQFIDMAHRDPVFARSIYANLYPLMVVLANENVDDGKKADARRLVFPTVERLTSLAASLGCVCVSAFVSPVTQAWAKNEDPRERLLLLFGQLLMLLGTHVDEIAIVPPECNMTVQCDFVTAYSAHMYLLKLLQTYPGNKTNAVYQLMLDTAKRRLLALSSWAKVAEPGARFSARTSAQARLGVDLAQLLADGISICATDLIPLCAQILFDLVLSPTILQNVSDADFATVLCAAASLVQTARLPGLSGTWSDKGLVQLVHALGAAIDTLAYFVSASRVDGRNRLTLAEALSLCGEAAVGLIAGFLSDITPLTECDWATQAPAGALCDLACRLDIIAQVMALVCRHMAPADLVRRIQPQKVLQSLCRLHHWMAHALRKRDPDTEGEEGEVHTSRERTDVRSNIQTNMDKWGKATVSAVALLTANPELHRACVPGWITCVPKKYLARHSARFLSPGLGADAELCAKINAPSLKGCSDGPPQHPVIVLAGSRSRRFRGLPVGGRQQRHELSEVYTSAVERFAQEVMRWGIRAPRTSAWQFVAPKSLLPTKIFQLCSAPACRRWLVKKKAGDWESGDMVLFRRCGRCRYAQYCSSECQLQHWVMPGGHRGCC